MAIWRGESAVASYGPEIHIKYGMFGLSSDYKREAAESVGLARIMLRQILTNMNGGHLALSVGQLGVMDYYFCLGGAVPTATDFDVIRQTLILTQHGLMRAGLNVKVTMQGDANGYVNLHDPIMGFGEKVRAKLGLSKARWTAGTDVDEGAATSFGDIHLDSDRIDEGPELAAKTIVHEATHKFASTTDFGMRGHTADTTGLYRAAGLTKAEAMNNAESYARFVMMSFLFP